MLCLMKMSLVCKVHFNWLQSTSEACSQTLIWLALQKLAREGETKPTFVVEVNDRCTGDQLEKLLLLMKYWGCCV